jgi:hypothetical protein
MFLLPSPRRSGLRAMRRVCALACAPFPIILSSFHPRPRRPPFHCTRGFLPSTLDYRHSALPPMSRDYIKPVTASTRGSYRFIINIMGGAKFIISGPSLQSWPTFTSIPRALLLSLSDDNESIGLIRFY